MGRAFTKNSCWGSARKTLGLGLTLKLPSLKLPRGLAMAAMLALVLSSCQMPSPTSSGSPMPSSSGGGSSGLPPSSPSPGGGMPAPGGSSAPSDGSSGTGGPSGADGSFDADGSSGADGSSDESGDSTESLDDALDASLEEFDDTVMGDGGGSSEIDILSPSGASGGVDSDEPLFEEVGEGGSDRSASIEQRAAEGASPGAEGEGTDTIEGSGNQSASAAGQDQADIIPIPEDIGDGQGDGIVLRQIRDAASKEQDPILREKLWDEYRRIKNQS
jgi:hypothetical protein